MFHPSVYPLLKKPEVQPSSKKGKRAQERKSYTAMRKSLTKKQQKLLAQKQTSMVSQSSAHQRSSHRQSH